MKSLERRTQHKETQQQINRLLVLNTNPGIRLLMNNIRADTLGGQPIRENLTLLGTAMGILYLQDKSTEKIGLEQTLPLVMAIPRGGTDMGNGIAQVMQTLCLYTNDGNNRRRDLPLLPATFPFGKEIDELIITDAITASGQTASKTITEANKAASIGKVVYITGLATPQGILKLLEEHENLSIITADIEEESMWVEKDGKNVLFVSNVGDIGDLASK